MMNEYSNKQRDENRGYAREKKTFSRNAVHLE